MDSGDKGRLILQNMKSFQKKMKSHFVKHCPDLNMTTTQGMFIGILMRNGDMKISDLSKRMVLSNSTVSGIVDRLEKNNVVVRRRSEEDRRIVMVGLNKEFKKESKLRFKALDQHFAEIMNRATPEELDTILEGFKILERLMSRPENNNNTQEQDSLC
jgi:MarR family transcriptional regulator, organic hydroperoxide resistance regulator